MKNLSNIYSVDMIKATSRNLPNWIQTDDSNTNCEARETK